tara:strand:- start:62 stop:637 length:576 start_codon:yes stop_codon:yes gene_type:complete
MIKKIIIIGDGGHANSLLDVIKNIKGLKFSGFVTKNKKVKKGFWTDKDLKSIVKKIKHAAIGVGQIKNPKTRFNIFKKLKKIGFKLPVIISPYSYVSKSASIREGSMVMHGVVINANVKIGKNCIINSNTLIEHDVTIGDNCHVSTSSTINGNSKIGNNSFIGSGSIVVNNVEIGNKKFVKAGTIVKRNLK